MMGQFQDIYIGRNPIAFIEDYAFAGLPKLEILQIAGCDLNSMPPLADVKDTLIDLSIYENRISFVPHGYFRGFKKLRMLTLTENLLTEVPDVTDLSSTLLYLNLQTNSIVYFPNWMLQISMAKLEKLEIFNNQIQVFPPMVLCHQFRLRYIGLSDNNLTTLSRYYDVTRGFNAEVHVDRNPLHCNSSLAWLSKHSHRRKDGVFMDTVEYIGAQCGSPQHLRGRSLDEIGVYCFVQSNYITFTALYKTPSILWLYFYANKSHL